MSKETFDKKLTDIAVDLFMCGQFPNNTQNKFRNINEATDAIKRLILSDVIGEDEQVYNQQYGVSPIKPSTAGQERMITRNVFRQNQRNHINANGEIKA